MSAPTTDRAILKLEDLEVGQKVWAMSFGWWRRSVILSKRRVKVEVACILADGRAYKTLRRPSEIKLRRFGDLDRGPDPRWTTTRGPSAWTKTTAELKTTSYFNS